MKFTPGMPRLLPAGLRAVLLLLALALSASAAGAPTNAPPPRDLNQRAGFDQHIGALLPMTTTLRDASGQTLSLSAISGGKPLLLAFGYYRCPNLCDLTLQGMARAAATMPLSPRDDYRVVFISIDPHESFSEARGAQAMTSSMSPGAHAGDWHFATAEAPAIASLTAAAGFRYFYDSTMKQFAHPAGVVVVTPSGRIAQYLFGVSYDPGALRLALVGASEGHLGGVIDRLVLLCCGYDPATGRYSLLISRLSIALSALFLAAMAAGAWWLRRRTAT